MAFDRTATEGDVQRAQFLNYLRAPKPIQQAMQKFSPDSQGYRDIQNTMASAEEDLGIRPGGVSTRDPMRDVTPFNPYARSKQLTTAFAERMPERLSRALSPEGERERVSRAPRQSAGSAGTYATINGRQMYVPKAGRYTTGEFEDELKTLSPDLAAGSTYGVDADRLRNAQQAQMYLAAGQALPAHLRSPSLGLASDLQQKADMRKQLQGQKEFERQKELAGIKTYSPNASKTPLEVRKGYLEGYRKEVDQWNQDQREAQKLQSRINAAVRAAGGDAEKAMVTIGYQGGKPEKISVREARDMLNQYLRAKPTREEYAALQGVDASYLDPSLGQSSVYDTAVRSGEATSFADPGLKQRAFSSGYTQAQLDQISPDKRAVAIKRLRESGDNEGASYLERLSSGRPSGRS